MPNSPKILNAALEYAQRGWAVFPCTDKKVPFKDTNGHNDATKDPNEIKRLFGKYRASAIGVATGKISGIFSFDVDVKNGAVGEESYEQLINKYGELPDTPQFFTWSGGRQYIFKYPKDGIDSERGILPGIDIRGDKGYMCVPPSVVSGMLYGQFKSGTYAWEAQSHIDDVPIAEAPEWLINLVKEYEKKNKKFKLPEGKIPKGTQDDSMFRLAYSLRAQNFTPDEIRSALQIALKKCEQDPQDPFTERDIERWIKSAYSYKPSSFSEQDSAIILPFEEISPLSLAEFLKQDFPPIEYLVEGILQKEGRTMISASTNTGKSFFLQDIALTIAGGQGKFLDKFAVRRGRILYLDFEMGNSALKERFKKMCVGAVIDNLFVKYLSGFNLLDKSHQQFLEKWLSELNVDVLIIDPIGDAWDGNENEKKEVAALTSYLNALKDKFKISLLFSHHWRKLSKDNKRGGEMASGSYKWGAWLEHHITLEGNIGSLTVACEKSRNSAKFEPFMIKLNEETLRFEFLADFSKEFNEQTLISVFESFGSERVSVPDLCKKAKEDKICSEDTLRKLIRESKTFEVDKSRKTHFIYKKDPQDNLFTSEKGVIG